MTIENTLKDRGQRYGEFETHAEIAQSIKDAMKKNNGWHQLKQHQTEALEMIAHKIARILNGDPDYADNWHDIAGYATLAEQLCPNDHVNNIQR